MCGIVGYLGEQDAFPLLIKGLKRLEYRGYDSAGIAVLGDDGTLEHYRRKGKVDDLLTHMEGTQPSGRIGIGHTRWATHGPPNDVNAHPHLSGDGQLALIHNGIIENYHSLKETLEARGHSFYSDTDTEVLVHLIEEIMKSSEDLDLFEATRIALNEVVGAYAIAVIDKARPQELVLARKSSPLVIGIGDGEFFIASDATPIVEYTKNVVYLEDNEVARVSLSS